MRRPRWGGAKKDSPMQRIGSISVAIGLAAMLAAAQDAGAAGLNALAIREAAAPRVCLVTVQNGLGVPLAYAAGFLMGEGRFAITDLASLAQAGAERALLQFPDGSTATARRFAMADPSIGLVAIRLEEDRPVKGLALSSAMPPAGEEVAVVAWRWTREPDLAVGRLAGETAAADLAARLKIEPPNADRTFLNFRGNRPDVASGAPVLDASGQVAGVLLCPAGWPQSLVVPAGILREVLLATEPELKPLGSLPKPIWPVAVVPMAQKPATPAGFVQALRTIKLRSRCSRCNGTGILLVSKVVGTAKFYGMERPVVRREQFTCPECRGEKVLFEDSLYDSYVAMAACGTWLALAGDVDPKARDATFANGLELLKSLAALGSRYRDGLIRRTQADLAAPDAVWPRGLLVFAQVRETFDGPDGRYVLLAPQMSKVLLAVRTDSLAAATDNHEDSILDYGDWIVLAGTGVAPVERQEERPIYLRPFAWARGPDLGPPPKRESAAPPPERPQRPSSTPPAGGGGAPNFFGL